MDSTEEVIALKQRILREAPGSGVMVKERDKIFYLKQPGFDATLSGSGTVSYRRGWGTQSQPTRYGGVITADKKLREEGFRPYNIFNGNQYEQYELRHLLARKDKERREAVFVPIELPKVKLGREQYESNIPDISYTPGQEIKTMSPYPVLQKPVRKMSYRDIIEQVGPQRKELDLMSRNISADSMSSQKFQSYVQGQEKLLSGAYRQFGLSSLSTKTKPAKKIKKKPKSEGGIYELL